MNEIEKLKVEQKDLDARVYQLEVVTREDYEDANELTKACIALEKGVKAYFDEPKKSAMATHKKLVAMEKEQLEPLAKMKEYLKTGMTGYILLEEAFHEGVRLNITARNTADEMLAVFDNEELKALRDRADEQSKKGRDDVHPELYKKEAEETLYQVKLRAPIEVEEVKAVNLNTRKLSLSHHIEVTSLRDLVDMVASGKAPLEWLQPNIGEITKTAKEYEDEEGFNKQYAGVSLTIERSVI